MDILYDIDFGDISGPDAALVQSGHVPPRSPSTGAAAMPKYSVPTEKEVELDMILEERFV